MAEYFFNHWKNLSTDILVKTVLSNDALWDADLSKIPGFANSVTENLVQIMEEGILSVIQKAGK